MNKSLKGCPFCGRTPKVLHRTDSLDGYFCAISCFCGGYSARAHQAATGADESEAYMKAALRWNRRVDDSGVESLQIPDGTCEAAEEETPSDWTKNKACRDAVLKTFGGES